MAQYTQINPDALVTALTPINNSLGGKQDKTDNTLTTTDKTVSGAINEINTKVSNLTGALTWKGKFDTLPAVTDYEAGNVVGVGNKEYVLTVTGSTKAWEELGDEGSYLLKSVAEETYAKKTSIPTVNDPKVSIKMNGAEKGSFTLNQASAGEVDLGTVITAHQDISGKVDKTLNAKAFEGITIQMTNSAADKAANVAAIKAYVDNLNALGVNMTKGFNVPVRIDVDDTFYGCLTGEYHTDIGYFLSGTIFSIAWGAYYIKDILIDPDGQYMELVNIKNDNGLSTTSKNLIGAINEVNTLAKKKQDKLTSGTNIKTINNQSILGSGNVDISAPIYVVPMIMSTDGYPIPDSSKIDTNKLSIYMKSGYTVIGKPVDSSAPIVSFITGNNGYHYHYFDEKKGMMVIRVYGNNLSQHEIEYNYQFAAPQDSGSTGVCGGVPVPTYDDKEKMLKGDGTWSEVKTIDGESLIGSGDIKIKNNDYYLPVSAFSGQTAVTQDVLDAIADVRDSQGKKHLYIYDESAALGAVAEASVANFFGKLSYYVSWMSYYGDYYNTIWAYKINSGSKEITDVSFRLSSFNGSTASASGRQGMVPAPTTADTESFLCGNGKWEKISGGSSAFNVGTFVLDPNNYKFSELVDAVFANKIIMLKDFLFFSHAYSVIAAPMDGDGSIVTTVAETKDVYCAFIYIGATQGGQVTQVTAIKFTGDNTWTVEPKSAGQLLCTDDYKVDTSMSDTSTNPVQNKVIKAYIDGLVGNLAAQLAQI